MIRYRVPKEKYEMCRSIGKMYCPVTDRCRDSNDYRKKCLDEMDSYYYYKGRELLPYYVNENYLDDYNIDEYKNEVPKDIELFKKGNRIKLENVYHNLNEISEATGVKEKTILENTPGLVKIIEETGINTVNQLKELTNIIRSNGNDLKDILIKLSNQPQVQYVQQAQPQAQAQNINQFMPPPPPPRIPPPPRLQDDSAPPPPRPPPPPMQEINKNGKVNLVASLLNSKMLQKRQQQAIEDELREEQERIERQIERERILEQARLNPKLSPEEEWKLKKLKEKENIINNNNNKADWLVNDIIKKNNIIEDPNRDIVFENLKLPDYKNYVIKKIRR